MTPRMRIFAKLAVAIGLFTPVGSGQKPPAPKPPPSAPPTGQPGRSPSSIPGDTVPTLPREDLVLFLRGRIATDDGTPVPTDVLVERVCGAKTRQQVYAVSSGDFTMQLGSRTDSYLDASAGGDGSPQYDRTNATGQGIPRRELTNCELKATGSGFRSNVVNLAGLTPTNSGIDVGPIIVHRTAKIKGTTLSAASYLAPKDAKKAYENGLAAEKKGKLADARRYFENAVEIYPKYTSAWFQLGAIFQKLEQTESARLAYTRATTLDSKFLPPYLSLASMAFAAEDWVQLLNLTNHILDLDPLKYGDVRGYILDLDSLDYAEAYFYNSAANYKLNKIADAERSGLKAERLDVRPRFPQLHLLLAEIFARKNDYASAISQTKIYLELAPHAKNTDQVRQRLAELEKLNGPAASSGNSNPN